MKILYILLLCLPTLFVHSQTNDINNITGTYLFEKATFTVNNYNTKSQVDFRTIIDPSELTEDDLIFLNVFREATISNGMLLSCMLPDRREYVVEGGVNLYPSKIESPDEADKRDQSFDPPKQLTPYELSLEGGSLIFKVRYLYGNSMYNFPLEGELIVILKLQN